jgi:hypothetical protein
MAGEFAGLVTDERIPQVVAGIERAVLKSFEEDAAPGRVILVTGAPRISRDEIRRRAAICMRIFRQLRGDLNFGIEKILDHLPKFLRCELDGIPWEPDATRTTWAAGSR